MRKNNKIVVFIFVALFLTFLTVRSEPAPNLLELYEGISVIGDLTADNVTGTVEFSVDRLWHDPFYDEDIVETSRDLIHTPPYDQESNVSREKASGIIFNDNRTAFYPVYKYHVESGDDITIVFLNITDSLEIMEEDLIVSYNGVNYTYEDIDPMSELYANISMWVMSWAFGNLLELELMPLTRYAISPQATTGQEIEYGPYTGDVIGFTEYWVDGTDVYEAIEVHHEEEIVIVDLFGFPQDYTVCATTLLYEKQTGIILHWMEYNSSADIYYYFNATAVSGITPIIPEYSVPFIIAISAILIATPVIINRRKKN